VIVLCVVVVDRCILEMLLCLFCWLFGCYFSECLDCDVWVLGLVVVLVFVVVGGGVVGGCLVWLDV